ncbi:MAG: N-acetylmuramidase domain-containing protein [Nannocystaceae bacterium]|nr:N-acetylmuramidase domain-containing protein [Nannocystaceae bacterium]
MVGPGIRGPELTRPLDLDRLRLQVETFGLRRAELRPELIREIDEPEQVFTVQPTLSRTGLAFIAARKLGVHPDRALLDALRDEAIDVEAAVRRLVTVALSQRQLDAIVAHAQRIGLDAFRSAPILADLQAGRFAAVVAALSPEEAKVWNEGEYGQVPDADEIDFDREIPKAVPGSIETVLDGVAIIRSGPPDFTSSGSTIPRYDRVRIDAVSADEAFVQVSRPAGGSIGWTVRSNLGGYFKDDPRLASVPLAPASTIAIDPAWSDTKRAVAKTFNRLGGLMSAITDQTGVPLAAVLAVWKVESAGAAHEPGKAIIRFENHLLYHRWGEDHLALYDQHFQHGGHGGVAGSSWKNHRFRADANGAWHGFHGDQSAEYEVLTFARQLCGDAAALACISIGGPQILVSNRRLIGYESEVAMYDAFQADERAHVLGFFDYCQYATGYLHRRRELIRDLRALRWEDFARGYNGSGQVAAYADKLSETYDAAASLQLPSPSPGATPPESPPPTPLATVRLSRAAVRLR